MIQIVLITLSMILFFASCGVEVGNPANPTNPDSSTGTTKVADDPDVVTLVASDHYNEALSAVTDTYDSRSSASLLSLAQNTGFDITFSCDDSGSETVVVKSTSGTVSYDVGIGARRRTVEESLSRSSTATWVIPNQEIACSSDSRRARVQWSGIDSLSLSIQQESRRDKTITRLSDEEVLLIKTVELNGNRTIQMSREATGIIVETMSYSIAHSVSYDSTDTTGSYQHTMQVDEATPLIIAKSFSDSNRLASFVIRSGDVRSTFDDESRLITRYDNLSFENDSCSPISGTMQGFVYESDAATEPTSSFTVEFEDSIGTITFDNGDSQAFEVNNCTFN
ncbi:hypothetical protein [Pseudobacteriovorax antillogorgiicola]|uniref:Lipoprotein n=1 Tax=Pseudobacteriovorax antillogorgiicola TaxID=1513793 RepID=A0A1Y6C9P5_9BACT|nr:hypothetical protein [Pseudobacteriovorax antillogorgiicola]TCS51705.1 hypothetical protein EDD56_11090 [Pseudobacteriovorax antillogorgiicola]SMF49263.1 hypothetical protein SAMN06296036_11559 [Pseudobacteriovorax antillogorgiicola]